MNSQPSKVKLPDKKEYEYRFIYIVGISLITALGGFLFGYDWVVIGGAKPFYEAYFGLTSSFEIGWAMSSALVGCLIGAALSGVITDKYGRKKVLIFAAILILISSRAVAAQEQNANESIIGAWTAEEDFFGHSCILNKMITEQLLLF